MCRSLLHCLILGAVGPGCSFVYDAPVQCRRDSDCVELARNVPALSGSYCEQQVCVQPVKEEVECETHAECVSVAKGDPAVCQNNVCVSLLHGECTQVLNAEALTTSDDVILLGAFSPLNHSLPTFEPELMNYQMALDEVTKNARGAIGYADYNDRPFVIVACRSDSANQLDASVDHLAKTLKAPVIISELQSTVLEEQVLRLIGEKTNTMVLSAFSSDPALLAMKDLGRLWHMLGTPMDLVAGYLRLIEEQMARVSAGRARVLMVVNDVRAMGEIADAVEKDLSINGLTVTDAMASGVDTYRRVAIESLALHPDNPDTSALSDALAEFAPNVIVLLAGPEVIVSGVTAIETGWSTLGLAEAPRYVLSHHLFNQEGLLTALQTSGGYEDRIYGINFAGAEDRSLYNTYLSNFKAEHQDAYREEYENFYDAAHFAMLSVIGVARDTPTADITGDLAVKGFKRLIDVDNGLPWALKRGNLANIAGLLETNPETTIQLTGTLGPPLFSADGGRHYRSTVWCVDSDSGKLAFSSSTVLYDETTGNFGSDISDCHRGSQ